MMAPSISPTFWALYTPKLVTVLRERYGLGDFKADVIAGLTVAIVALPLSMAIAIASGVTPDRGLYTAIIGGFVVSAIGGSRFQIGGPAGAFIVLVLATVTQFGIDGLLLATMLSGFFLVGIGALRLGTFIKYIPYPVTVGFTAGIAAIIAVSQIKELLGLTIPGAEPGPVIAKLAALGHALPTLNAGAIVVGALTVAGIILVRRSRPHWPAFLIAVVAASAITLIFRLPIETIGSRFGGIPDALPSPRLPAFTGTKIIDVLPSALSFSLLGEIESLLSAVVADSMSGRRHRSNCELVAQGIANIASACFGGICVTGTIARTATNVRAGARGPVAGMLHSVFLLLFMLVAAPLAGYIPLAALGGLLVAVSWNMAERHAFAVLLRASRGDAVVLLATFLLVVFRDLTEGIIAGFAIGTVLFVDRMARLTQVDSIRPMVQRDQVGSDETHDIACTNDTNVVIVRIQGAFFFAAAGTVETALAGLSEHPKAYVIDMAAVPVLDSTGAATIAAFARKARSAGVATSVSGASAATRRVLLKNGINPPDVLFSATIKEALAQVASL